MPAEPSQIEILLTRIVGNVFPGIYREYINPLPIQGNETILDYGSGSGYCSKHLANRLTNGGHLYCVDISSRWQKVCRKTLRNHMNVSFHLGPMNTILLPKRIFDVIFIHYVLHDIPSNKRETLITDLLSYLKPNGRIIIREPLSPDHGISEMEINNLFQQTGCKQSKVFIEKNLLCGINYQGIFQY
jgi:ubiquinone/menaquinone biosynthesis C-methylase UbiE